MFFCRCVDGPLAPVFCDCLMFEGKVLRAVRFLVLQHISPLHVTFSHNPLLLTLTDTPPPPSTRSSRYSLRKRPNENSEQFKMCFFRFLRFLLRDLVKRRHRTIVKERQAAAEQLSKTAPAGSVATARRGARGAGSYDADDRMRRQPPPRPPPASSNTSNPHSGMPAAVRG